MPKVKKFLGGFVIIFVFITIFISVVFAAEGDILLFDDFNDGNANGWTILSGNWSVDNGNLKNSQTGRALAGRVNRGEEWDNYKIEVDVNNEVGIDIGIGFRRNENTGEAYELVLRFGNGAFNTPQIILNKAQDGIVTTLGNTKSVALNNNQWYKIRLEAVNTNIKVWVNNTSVFNIQDNNTKVKKGFISLSTWTGDFSAITARFDNVKVTDLNVSPPKTPLILIPGIGGSELKVQDITLWNKDNGHGGTYNRVYGQDEKVWVNEGEAGNPGHDDYFDVLRMKTDGVNSEANLGLTGNLYAGAYQGAINFFTSNGYTLGQDFFVFPYDWRKDLKLTKDLLDQKIQQIKTQTASSKVDIVAHSMGGLVARNYITDPAKAPNVRKLFTLGTPHLGTVESLKNIVYGGCITKLPLLTQLFCLGISPSETKDVIQNMISGYELAPSQKYFDFYSGQDNQHPYPYRTENRALNYSQIKNLLTSLEYNTPLFTPSEIFHSLDSNLSITNGVEVTNIVGSGQPTLGQIIEEKTTSLLGIQSMHREMLNINGDETVPLLSASSNISSTFYTNQKHGGLVANGPALNLVKNILNGDSQIPSGVSSQPYLFNGTSVSSYSPINIHAYDTSGNHTGPLPNGDFEVNIPGSSYDTLGDAKFIFLPDDGQYTIRFEATDNGSFDFKIRKYEDDVNTETIFYNDVPINSTSTGQTTLDTQSGDPPTLQIDQQNINATATLTGNANYDQTPPITTIQLSGTQGNNSWFKSDVLVSLNSTDESGIEKIEYTLDNGQTIQTYSGPFTISQEGILKLKFKATDKAGNEENPQEVEIKIDKTPPEAIVQFNLTTQNLEINGQEINPGEVILTDEAGNTTKLQVEPKEKKRKEKLEIKTISYNDGSVINLPDNKFEVKFKDKDLDQVIKIKGEEKLKAKYNPKKNITKIEIKEQGQKKRVEERNGIVLLQLLTNKGQLSTNF